MHNNVSEIRDTYDNSSKIIENKDISKYNLISNDKPIDQLVTRNKLVYTMLGVELMCYGTTLFSIDLVTDVKGTIRLSDYNITHISCNAFNHTLNTTDLVIILDDKIKFPYYFIDNSSIKFDITDMTNLEDIAKVYDLVSYLIDNIIDRKNRIKEIRSKYGVFNRDGAVLERNYKSIGQSIDLYMIKISNDDKYYLYDTIKELEKTQDCNPSDIYKIVNCNVKLIDVLANNIWGITMPLSEFLQLRRYIYSGHIDLLDKFSPLLVKLCKKALGDGYE